MENKIKDVEKIAKELFSLLGSKTDLEVSFDEKNEAVVVDVKTEDEAGLLIGRQGETLMAIQTILGMMVRKGLGEWVRIVVNVGDWREKQESYLKEMALQTAARAKETGEPQYLYNLTSNQRRIIHLTLSEDGEVETESQGEDKERYLIIRKK